MWNLAPGSVEDRRQSGSEQYWWCDELRLPRPARPLTKRAACQFLESRQFGKHIINGRTAVGQHGRRLQVPTGQLLLPCSGTHRPGNRQQESRFIERCNPLTQVVREDN